MSGRWLGTHLAAAIWGGGICPRTMARMCERWHDSGYALGAVEVTPGGHWRVREDFLVFQRDRGRAAAPAVFERR